MPATKWKLAAVASSCAFLALLLGILLYGYVREAFGLHRLDSAAVVTQVKQLNQLVTVRYRIEQVVGMREPKVPFGEESILLMVQGEALAGVDLATMTPRDVQLHRQAVRNSNAARGEIVQCLFGREADEGLGSADHLVDALGTVRSGPGT